MPVALVRPDILYAGKGPSLLIVNTRGKCGPDQPLSGHYFRETRFLRMLRLEINGERPWVCEAASLGPSCLALNFVHPEIKEPGGGGTGQSGDDEVTDSRGIPERSLDVRLLFRVGVADLTIAVAIANRARRPIACDLAWALDADFADIQEAQAGKREQRGSVEIARAGDRIEFSYQHPTLGFRTQDHHDGTWRLDGHRLLADVAFEPKRCSGAIGRAPSLNPF